MTTRRRAVKAILNVVARDGDHFEVVHIVSSSQPAEVDFEIATAHIELADILV